MFQTKRVRTQRSAAASTLTLLYHHTVFKARGTHNNAVIGLLLNMMQAFMLLGVFYILFAVTGMRSAAIRGDFMLYLMSGVMIFMAHTKTMNSVAGSEAPGSALMQHTPMNTIVSMAGAALSALYIQSATMFLSLLLYHSVMNEITIDNAVGAYGMVLMGWFTGAAVGVVFYAVRPWFPTAINVLRPLYMRVNMVASGKMFVANMLPPSMLAMFDWNPLFHCIDQARGFTFINYYPRNSSIEYPLYVGLVLLVIGMMIEYITRRKVSLSWAAKS
ncbi:MAG: ABC transporter permease [Pseudomonadota bacterium]